MQWSTVRICLRPLMTTKQLGNIGEALAKLVSMNVPVYVSFGDNEKADLVAEFNGKLNKLQVKTSENLKMESLLLV